MKLNYQVEVQNHIHAQVQFQEKDNLPKCQQDLKFGQVQMGGLKLNLGFQNNMILWLNRIVNNIKNGQRMRMESFDH